jgi:hypothetical protein
VSYISIDILKNESLSFKTILTKVTFITTSVESLMLDPTCFVLRLSFGTFIFAYELVKCRFEAFVALSRVLNFSAKTEYSDFPNWTVQF